MLGFGTRGRWVGGKNAIHCALQPPINSKSFHLWLFFMTLIYQNFQNNRTNTKISSFKIFLSHFKGVANFCFRSVEKVPPQLVGEVLGFEPRPGLETVRDRTRWFADERERDGLDEDWLRSLARVIVGTSLTLTRARRPRLSPGNSCRRSGFFFRGPVVWSWRIFGLKKVEDEQEI